MGKLFFAAEEEVIEVAPEANELPVELVEEVGEAQAESAEIGVAVEELEESVADLETLDDAADVLEESVAPAEGGEEGEGVSEDAAEVAEIVVESICDRLGMPARMRPQIATESFGGRSSRKLATRLAAENMKETVAKGWEKVKKFFIDLYSRIKDFLKGLFDVNKRIQAQAEALLKKVPELKGEAAEKTMENRAVAKAFGGVAETVLANHIQLTATLTTLTEKVGATMEAVGKVAEKPAEATAETVGQAIAAAKIEGSLQAVSGKSFVLVNGTHFYVTAHEADVEGAKGYIRVDEESIYKNNKFEAKPVDVLTADQMTKLLGKVKELSADTDKLKNIGTSLDKAVKAIDKTISAVIKGAGKKAEGDEAKAGVTEASGGAKAIRRAISDLAALNAKLAQRVPALNVVACKAALSYVVASQKQYKEAKAA